MTWRSWAACRLCIDTAPVSSEEGSSRPTLVLALALAELAVHKRLLRVLAAQSRSEKFPEAERQRLVRWLVG